MRKSILLLLALAILPVASFAQSLVGIWQGTLSLPNGKELRMQFKVLTTDNDTLKAVMYSVDQTPQGFPSTVSVQAPNVKFTIPGAAGTYEGKLGTDNNSITGTWAQGPGKLPLNLARVNADTAWPLLAATAQPKAMDPKLDPTFEVATIKPSRPEQAGKAITVNGRRLITIGTGVSDLVAFAYGVHTKQIVGGPSWLESERFDITAEPDGEGIPNQRQLKVMLKKLLSDRFKLTFHQEKKELSAYVLMAGKGGPKLTTSGGDPNGLPGLGFTKLGSLFARNATMSDLAGLFQYAVLDRPVVDRTEVTGHFDFSLDWTPDQSQFTGLGVKVPAPSDDPSAPPDLFAAIVQQLGLKLDSAKTSVDVMVVDTVEKPSAN